MNQSLKQTIIVREDLEISTGKLAAQVAHASLNAAEIVRKKDRRKWQRWMDNGAKKIVLKVESEKRIHKLADEANRFGVVYSIVKDAGHTELSPGTITALGLGPDNAKKIDKISGSLDIF